MFSRCEKSGSLKSFFNKKNIHLVILSDIQIHIVMHAHSVTQQAGLSFCMLETLSRRALL